MCRIRPDRHPAKGKGRRKTGRFGIVQRPTPFGNTPPASNPLRRIPARRRPALPPAEEGKVPFPQMLHPPVTSSPTPKLTIPKPTNSTMFPPSISLFLGRRIMGEEEGIWDIDYSRKDGGETRGKPGKPEETQRRTLATSAKPSGPAVIAARTPRRRTLGRTISGAIFLGVWGCRTGKWGLLRIARGVRLVIIHPISQILQGSQGDIRKQVVLSPVPSSRHDIIRHRVRRINAIHSVGARPPMRPIILDRNTMHATLPRGCSASRIQACKGGGRAGR